MKLSLLLFTFLAFEASFQGISGASVAAVNAVTPQEASTPGLAQLPMPLTPANDPRTSPAARQLFAFLETIAKLSSTNVSDPIDTTKLVVYMCLGLLGYLALLSFTIYRRHARKSANKAVGRRVDEWQGWKSFFYNAFVVRMAQLARLGRGNQALPPQFKEFMTQASVGVTVGLLSAGIKACAELLGMDPGLAYMIFTQLMSTICNMLGEMFVSGVFLGKHSGFSELAGIMLKFVLIAVMDNFIGLNIYIALIYLATSGFKTRMHPVVSTLVTLSAGVLSTVGYVMYMRADWALPDDDSLNPTKLPPSFYHTQNIQWIAVWFVMLTFGVCLYALMGRNTQRYMVEKACVTRYNDMVNNNKGFCEIYNDGDMSACISFCKKGIMSLASGNEDICTALKDGLNTAGPCSSSKKDELMYTITASVLGCLLFVALVFFFFWGKSMFVTRRVIATDLAMRSAGRYDRNRRVKSATIERTMTLERPPTPVVA